MSLPRGTKGYAEWEKEKGKRKKREKEKRKGKRGKREREKELKLSDQFDLKLMNKTDQSPFSAQYMPYNYSFPPLVNFCSFRGRETNPSGYICRREKSISQLLHC